MEKAKKTVTVEYLKAIFNKRLRKEGIDTYTDPKVRRALASVLDEILFHTNNYHGFNYVEWIEGGHEQWEKDNKINNNFEKDEAYQFPKSINRISSTKPYIKDESRVKFY